MGAVPGPAERPSRRDLPPIVTNAPAAPKASDLKPAQPSRTEPGPPAPARRDNGGVDAPPARSGSGNDGRPARVGAGGSNRPPRAASDVPDGPSKRSEPAGAVGPDLTDEWWEEARPWAKATSETLCVADPIDVSTGQMIYTATDATLPGLRLERTHRSGYGRGRWFGPAWASTLDQRIVTEGRYAKFLAADGSVLTYPLPAEGDEVRPLMGRHAPLRRLAGGRWELILPDATLSFARSGENSDFPLSGVSAGATRWTVERDAGDVPVRLLSSTGDAVALDVANGRVTGLRYEPAGAEAVDLTSFEYDGRHDLVAIRNSSGDPMRLTYDEAGRIVRWDDRNGEWYTYIYDEAGRCVQADGNGGYLRYRLVYADGATTVTDSVGAVTRYELNDRLQVTAIVDPLGGTTRREWDAANLLLSETDPLGRTTRFTYDQWGRPLTRVLADGTTAPGTHARPAPDQVLGLDAWGRPRWVRSASGTTTELGWTVEGELAWRARPDSSLERWRYDGEGNLVETIDAEGRSVHIEYGQFDQPVARIDEAGNRTQYAYDTELRLTSVTDPAGRVWRYSYDAAGRLASETDFDGRVQIYTRDAAGQVTAHRNASGETTYYAYDLAGRVVQRRIGDAVTRMSYDAAGHLAVVESPDAVVSFERDDAGRVLAETINGRTVRISYRGDVVSARVTPSGRSSRWTFDERGLPSALTVGGHTMSFEHDVDGREIGRSVDGVPALRQTYDEAGRLAAQQVAGVGRVGLAYDTSDRVTAIGDLAFTADATGRIRTVTRGGEQIEQYDYDEAGNVVGTGGGRWQFEGSRLLRSDDARFTYDAKGRLVTRVDGTGTWRFTWDAEDRLVQAVTAAGERWRYRYDAFDRRIAKQRLADDDTILDETVFSWAGDHLVEETGAAGTTSWDFLPGGSEPVAQTGDELRTVVTDGIGTPTHLVSPEGELRWGARGELWGRSEEPGGTPLRFPGQYFDAETGLHYNRFRYYDPSTARYISPDPMGLAGGPDPTAYVSDPLTVSDPLGLADCPKGGKGGSPVIPTGDPSGGPTPRPTSSTPGEPDAPATIWTNSGVAPTPSPTEPPVEIKYFGAQPTRTDYSVDTLAKEVTAAQNKVEFNETKKSWETVDQRFLKYPSLANDPALQNALAKFKDQINFELLQLSLGRDADQIKEDSRKEFGTSENERTPAEEFTELLAFKGALSIDVDSWRRIDVPGNVNVEEQLKEVADDLRGKLALWGKIGPVVAKLIAKMTGKRVLEDTPAADIFNDVKFGTPSYFAYPPGLKKFWVDLSRLLVEYSDGTVDVNTFIQIDGRGVTINDELPVVFAGMTREGRFDAVRTFTWDFLESPVRPGKKVLVVVDMFEARSRGSFDRNTRVLAKDDIPKWYPKQQTALFLMHRYAETLEEVTVLRNNRQQANLDKGDDFVYVYPEPIKFDNASHRRGDMVALDDEMIVLEPQDAEDVLAEHHVDLNVSPERRPSYYDAIKPIVEAYSDLRDGPYQSGKANAASWMSHGGTMPDFKRPPRLPRRTTTFVGPLGERSRTFSSSPDQPGSPSRRSRHSSRESSVSGGDVTVTTPERIPSPIVEHDGPADADLSTEVQDLSIDDSTESPAVSLREAAPTAKSNDQTAFDGDPIDVTTGRMVLMETDATLPGLVLERVYRSGYGRGRSFGPDWASTLDQRIVADGRNVRYLAADGSVLTYPLTEVGETAFPIVGRSLPLLRLDGGYWRLDDPVSGQAWLFAGVDGAEALVTEFHDGGVRWSFVRDGAGTPTAVRSSNGVTVEFASAGGLITTLSLPDRDGTMTAAFRFRYSGGSLLNQVVNSSGDPTTYTYADGRLVRWDDRNGDWYQYAYDEQGRCVSTDGSGGYLRYRFDYSDGLTTVTDSLGAQRRYEINELFQVVAETDALGATTRNEWDSAHRLLAQTDPMGRTTRYEYDAAGRPSSVTRPDGSRSMTAYDEAGRVVAWTDFDGTTRTREFDATGIVRTETGPTGETVWPEQLPVHEGLPTAAVKIMPELVPDGRRRYSYDHLGRIVAVENEDGVTTVGWTTEGDLAWKANPDGTVEAFGYDGEGNMVESVGSDGDSTLREYGPFALMTAEIDPEGNRTAYEYDTELQLAAITNSAGETWRYTYDAAGRVVEETDFAGRTQRYAYDAAGQLVEHVDAEGEVTVLTYDVLGQLVERRVGEAVTRLIYDAAGRIIAAADPDSDIQLEHDALGRVVSETVNGQAVLTSYGRNAEVAARTFPSGVVTRWSYDDSGRPTVLEAAGHRIEVTGLTTPPAAAPVPVAPGRFTFDASGRLADGTDGWRLTWAQGRLSTVLAPEGDSWHYRYDALGRRISKQHRDAGGALLEETSFVWFGDRLVEQRHTGPTGEVTTTTWEYLPAGADPVVQFTGGALEPMGSLLAGGRYLDAETGLRYDRTGYHDQAYSPVG